MVHIIYIYLRQCLDKAVWSRQCEISEEDTGWAGERYGSGGDGAAEESRGDTGYIKTSCWALTQLKRSLFYVPDISFSSYRGRNSAVVVVRRLFQHGWRFTRRHAPSAQVPRALAPLLGQRHAVQPGVILRARPGAANVSQRPRTRQQHPHISCVTDCFQSGQETGAHLHRHHRVNWIIRRCNLFGFSLFEKANARVLK